MRHLLLALATLTASPVPAAEFCLMGADRAAGCEAIRAREIVDADQPPWRAIGRVNFASTDVRMHCTGTLVAEDVVLTAAHCLFNHARKAWIPPGSVRFVAGYQRGEAAAVASVTRYVVDPALDRSARRFDAPPPQDWALMILDAPLGREMGVLPLDDLTGGTANVAGYPAIRPHVLSRSAPCPAERRGTQAGPVLLADCPTMFGDSGAPFLVDTEGGPRVVGVLSGVGPVEGRMRSIAAGTGAARRALAHIAE